MKPVVVVIDDLDSVRVDPAAAGSPTPPWRRDLRRIEQMFGRASKWV
jgi:hypothetical protein